MKKVKSLLSVVLAALMILSVFIAVPITASAASHTQDEAVAWAKAQVGKSLDYDGAYGAQCVDLIAFYYQYLGTQTPGGNGCDYCRNALPSGWQRIQNYSGYTPQPGDICVWDSYVEYQGVYGHVGIVVGGDSNRINTVEQNVDGSATINFSRNTSLVSCFIRPDFTNIPHTPEVNNPYGYLDKADCPAPGKLHVKGWAFDKDDINTPIEVHIGVGGVTGSTALYGKAILANKERTDVNKAFPGVGNYHGFDETFDVPITGSQEIYAYAINIGGGSNQQLILSPQTVNIQKDTEKPTISDITMCKISSKGCRISFRTIDNVGLKEVKYKENGSSEWKAGSLLGETGSCYLKSSNGKIEAEIRVYDTSDNFIYIKYSLELPDNADEPAFVAEKEYNGNTYEVLNADLSWTEAEIWCEKHGGHLATISDENEWNAVKNLLKETNGIRCWLGASKQNNTFSWVDDTVFANDKYKKFWGEGQPDNAGGKENYLGTYGGTFLDCYDLNDFVNKSDQVYGFVCEYEKQEPTTEPTSESIQPITEPTQPTETQPVTDNPNEPTETQPVTDNPTEPTETQPATDIPTEPTETQLVTDNPTVPTEHQPVTDTPTEPTDPQPATDSPTEPTEIKASQIDISGWYIEGLEDVEYTGKKIKPEFDVVSDDGEYADFTVKFKNNKKVGTATATITGVGNYTGTIVTTFEILKAKQPMTVKAVTKKASRSKLRRANVKVKPLTIKKAQGAVSCKKLSGSDYLTVSKKGVITVKKGWYYKNTVLKIKVKITAQGGDNYKKGSKTVTVKIKVK